MLILDAIVSAIFIPIWPMGFAIPAIATIVLHSRGRKHLVKLVPLICTSVWLLVRIMLMWDVIIVALFPDAPTRTQLDPAFAPIIIGGTLALALVMLACSAFTTWATSNILTKLASHKNSGDTHL